MKLTRDIGIKLESLEKFIKEQIYTLPGIEDHRSKLTIVLTGSRAIGTYSDKSDVDLDVIEAVIDETWVQDGYDNVDELLQGLLGPTP